VPLFCGSEQDRKLGDAAVPFGGKAGHARDLHASGELCFEITPGLHESISHMALQARARTAPAQPRGGGGGAPSYEVYDMAQNIEYRVGHGGAFNSLSPPLALQYRAGLASAGFADL
jgi:hypothetical protein